MNEYEIRADHDSRSIIVYQAYGAAIAQPALRQQRFVEPFSTQRMTWVNLLFLWLMYLNFLSRTSSMPARLQRLFSTE